MASINGFSVVHYGDKALATYPVPGTAVRLSLRREVAPLLLAAAAEWHTTVEPLRPASCWGHAYRTVRGGANWSFHACGIAVDFNADSHPMGTATYTDAQRHAIDAIVNRHTYQGRRLLRWGGHYSGRIDQMHLECIADRSTTLTALRAAHPAAPGTIPYPGRPLALGTPAGPNVAALQRALARAVHYTGGTGPFGPRTRAAVLAYQQLAKLTTDGVVGPKTWAALRPTK